MQKTKTNNYYKSKKDDKTDDMDDGTTGPKNYIW